MARKLLIDATLSEEIRVAVVDKNRLEEFDSEVSSRKQLKGNIYLAKIVRIEPSLQAAFVDFGGMRHGFLPFSEIHPDYYRIPVSDRPNPEVLSPAVSKDSDAPEGASKEPSKKKKLKKGSATAEVQGTGEEQLAGDAEEQVAENGEEEIALVSHNRGKKKASTKNKAAASDEVVEKAPSQGRSPRSERDSDEEEQDLEDIRPKTPRFDYKIQEVVKRRQIMLVQIVKEERGQKGAALTTYLSLPGRYCVLMPNSGKRSGGVSRKIVNTEDRKRLKSMVESLELPDEMGLIVRTAGQEKNKMEIRRDYEYLLRLWHEIREKTMQSVAPALVYAEGDIIKRSIRDLYSKDIEEIFVEGDEAYKSAKAFMKMLIPSHVKKVNGYNDPQVPLFHKYKIEEQIDAMMTQKVQLSSGGTIVINPTEALTAIDVNSGKSTRERHIDETALKTNLEAAEEVARQLRLRDLGGLIVVDFIDMSDSKHIQIVEKHFREALKGDRARIQLGRISQFGLLELSRQRLKPSLIELNTSPCQHCQGSGLVRSAESLSTQILRSIRGYGAQGTVQTLKVFVPREVDTYLLNTKRKEIYQIEEQCGMTVQIFVGSDLAGPHFLFETILKESLVTENKEPGEGLVFYKEASSVESEDSEKSSSSSFPKSHHKHDRKPDQRANAKGDQKSHEGKDPETSSDKTGRREKNRSSAPQEQTRAKAQIHKEELKKAPAEAQQNETPEGETPEIQSAASKDSSRERRHKRRRFLRKNRQASNGSSEPSQSAEKAPAEKAPAEKPTVKKEVKVEAKKEEKPEGKPEGKSEAKKKIAAAPKKAKKDLPVEGEKESSKVSDKASEKKIGSRTKKTDLKAEEAGADASAKAEKKVSSKKSATAEDGESTPKRKGWWKRLTDAE